MLTFEEWTKAARCYSGFSDRESDKLHLVAMHCYEAQQAGGFASVWHSSAIVADRRCYCVACSGSGPL